MWILYPADYFDAKQADEYYRDEREVASSRFFTALYDDFNCVVLGDVDFAGDEVLWRGWQMVPDTYAKLVSAVESRNGRMSISADEYLNAHDAVRYIPQLNDGSGRMLVNGDDLSQAAQKIMEAMCGEEYAGGAFVKDSVKCVEGHTFIPANADKQSIRRELRAIFESREGRFSGWFVVAPWLPNMSAQRRVFVRNGEYLCSGRHYNHGAFDTGELPDEEECSKLACGLGLDSPLYTVDIAKDIDTDKLVIIECGDGQVSEIPHESLDTFYKGL